MSLTALKKKRSSREKNLVRFCWSNKDHNLSLRVWSPFGRENTETKETRLKNKYLNTKHDKHRVVVRKYHVDLLFDSLHCDVTPEILQLERSVLAFM